MPTPALTETNLGDIPLYKKGKVRDVYDLGDSLLIVSTDRISAFDVVFAEGIPRKGEVLTQLSLFWFDQLGDVAPNHLITADVSEMPEELQPYKGILERRSMQVVKTEVYPVEWVARGYLAGSGWKDYQKTGAVCGVSLPEGLKNSSKLPETIFTPATKAEEGHDENIGFETVVELIGKEAAEDLRAKTLRIYERGREVLASRGIILCDTKLEWGHWDGQRILIDEVLTPDSSRFWPADDYEEGRAQKSWDKQYVRDHLETLDWDKTPPPPALPPEVVEGTTRRYIEAYEKITGRSLDG